MAAIRLITEFFHAVLVVCSTYGYKTATPVGFVCPHVLKVEGRKPISFVVPGIHLDVKPYSPKNWTYS